MKIANIREFRSKATTYLKENEPVLITRHGKITGLLYPIQDTDVLPDNLQKDVGTILGTAQTQDMMSNIVNELKKVVKMRKVNAGDIRELQKQWKFKGNLSDELAAERNKR